MFKQSVSLIVVPAVVILSAGLANAHEVEVKAGNTQVSVQNGQVRVNSNTVKTPSLLNRLSNLRLFNGRRSSAPSVESNLKCDRSSSGYSTTRSSSSGTGVSRSSSTSTTMTCN